MATLISPNVLLILSLICFGIAIVGQSKFAFIEINPGCFGRTIALVLGISTLVIASGVSIPLQGVTGMEHFLTQHFQQGRDIVNNLISSVLSS